MQTYPVFFHDWHGIAIRADGHWWLAPRQVSDHLELSWRRQERKISGSNLKAGTALRAVPAIDQNRQMLTMKLGHFGAWMLGIEPMNVPEPKRPRLIAMQEALLDALERQLSQMFGLPLMEAEDMLRLRMPAWSGMTPEACQKDREAVIADPQGFAAAQLMRVGLPASRVAPLVRRSVYWARRHQRRCRRIGLVPLPPAQQRLMDEPSLFGEG
jgi:hypothetical protein